MFPARILFVLDDDEEEEVDAINNNPQPALAQPPQNLRRERLFRDRLDPLQVPDAHLVRYYRLPRHLIIELSHLLEPELEHPTRRTHSLPVMLQVLLGLRFLASGGFQSLVGDISHVSQSTCSRVLTKFCEGLVRLSQQYIQNPLENAAYVIRLKEGFHRLDNMPNVIGGAIDGTHILLMPPRHDKPNYINRKGQTSLNVQAVCDAQLRILDVVVRWPGALHDSFIWANCLLKRQLDRHICPGAYLIGDSGYPLEQYLLTPFRNPATAAQQRYNQAHIKTRNTIERCFGNLKSRFRSLHSSGGVLMYTPEKVQNIIVAACVLHNMCINEQVPLDQADLLPLDDQPPQQNVHLPNRAVVVCEAVRLQVVDRYQPQ